MSRKRLLVGILLAAFLLRTVNISAIPSGFTPDEASFGYDSFSILKTGKDQWGRTFPLVLESFGDNKSPLFSYIMVPFILVFSLTKEAVRLPNALLATAGVYVTYLLVRQLFESKKKNINFDTEKLALCACFLLAVSPWHIMMSRGGFEANLTTFFLPLGVYLFLKGFKKPKLFIYSALFMGLNLFTYHSAKLVTPLVFVSLVFIYKDELSKIKKENLYKPTALFMVFLAVMVYTFSLGSAKRAQDISIFQGALEEQSSERLKAIESGLSPAVARILNNKYQIAAKRFIANYKQYYSFKFLFTDGPGETTYGMLPGRGVLYWFELPFLISAGWYFYKKRKIWDKQIKLVLIWFLASAVPASLVLGAGYSANRVVIMLPAIQIFLSFGAVMLLNKIKDKSVRYLYLAVSLFFVAVFVKDYFFLSPYKSSQGMLYGNIEAVKLVQKYQKENIIVSRKLSEPHIYVAFVNRWDPSDYQKNSRHWEYEKAGVNWVDQLPTYSLGNYVFENIDWEIHADSNFLLVGKPEEFPEGIEITDIVKFPDGKPAIYIVDPERKEYAKKIN